MSSMGQGYFPSDLSPEDQEAMQAIRRKQAYAQALLSSDAPQGRFGGLASAGNKLLGAFLANRTDAKDLDLAKSISDRNTKDWSTILGGGSQPPLAEDDPRTGGLSGHMPQQAPGMEGPGFAPPAPSSPQIAPGMGGQAVSPQGPAGVNPQSSMMARALATGNPALLRQLGPMMLQSQMGRDQKIWENSLPMSQAAKDESAAQLQNQEGLSTFNNQLPMTAAQRAEDARAKNQIGLGYAQLNKPQFVPYGSGGYMTGNQFHEIPGGAGASPFGVGDPKSPSINGQTGLSSMGYNYITGNTSQMGMRDKAMAAKETDQFIARTGLDPSTVKPQVQAFQSAVNMNTLKANTMDTLAKEVTGTVQNYGPVIDKLTGSGNLRLTNQGFELVGSAMNDPTAQKAIFYLNQMRADMAGFNAASGGKIGVHGQTQTDNADFAKADEVIKSGLSSGGARALAEAIEATRQKNVGVAKQQVMEAQRGIWNALGVGKNFDATRPGGATVPEQSSGGGKTVVSTGTDKATGKKVVKYSDGTVAYAP